MASPLEIIVRDFVRERGISIIEKKRRFRGSKDPLSLVFGGRSNRLLLRKKSPALKEKNESSVYVSEGEQILVFSVLYGCLHDYIVALDDAQSRLCQDIQELLLFRHQSYERRKPDVALVEEVDSITYAGVAELLNSFYPIG